jgi:penicillin-binding protein-related factor A (putative recombinase)
MLINFHHPRTKAFVWRAFLQRKEKDACYAGKRLFFACKKARQTTRFCPGMMKNGQHQHRTGLT